MPDSARFFLCARCRSQVVLCRRCDRGQVYCARDCALAARQQSLRQANQRYAKSRRARVLSAQRQHRHRLRQRSQRANKVTDQGSAAPKAGARLNSSTVSCSSSLSLPVKHLPGEQILCHHCARVCANRVRIGFLPRGHRRRPHKPP